MSAAEIQAAEWCDRVWGERKGHFHFAFGVGGHFNDAGKYEFKHWHDRSGRWPDDRDRFLADALERADTDDVYVAPYLRSGASRKKGSALPSDFLYADLDERPERLRGFESLLIGPGGLLVASGRGQHVYLHLPADLEPDALEHWNRRLARRLDADAGWAENKVLRLPGTFNHKGRALGGESMPVLLLNGWSRADKDWSPAELAALLPEIEEVVIGGSEQISPVMPETVPERLLDRLEEEPNDRSKQTFNFVRACLEEGLSEEETLALALQHRPTREKYGERAEGEIVRTILKVRPAGETNSTGRRSSELVADSGPPADRAVDYLFGASYLREEAPNRSSSGQPKNFFDASEEVPNLSLLRVEEIHAFAAVEEPGAEPLLGDDEVCVLALDGTMTTYGTGGAAKTTTAVDRALHYAAGDPWLGIPIPSSRRVLIIENEGPRGRFRKKLEAKLASWTGSQIEEGRIHVFSEPWGMLRFDDPRARVELTAQIDALGIEVIVAGPIKRLGLQGGGTPEEVQAFLLLLEEVKQRLGRPLAYDLTHHPNKAGSVSGDWEGTGDTLVRLDKRGPRASTLTWEKVRWGGMLQGTAWKLAWADGERFEIEETPDRTEEDIAAEMLGFVAANPGTTWSPVQKKLKGTAATNVEIRDRLVADGALVNKGAAKQGAAMKLYLPRQEPPDDQITLADLEEVLLDVQRETGEYGHPLADMTAEAQRRKREGKS